MPPPRGSAPAPPAPAGRPPASGPAPRPDPAPPRRAARRPVATRGDRVPPARDDRRAALVSGSDRLPSAHPLSARTDRRAICDAVGPIGGTRRQRQAKHVAVSSGHHPERVAPRPPGVLHPCQGPHVAIFQRNEGRRSPAPIRPRRRKVRAPPSDRPTDAPYPRRSDHREQGVRPGAFPFVRDLDADQNTIVSHDRGRCRASVPYQERAVPTGARCRGLGRPAVSAPTRHGARRGDAVRGRLVGAATMAHHAPDAVGAEHRQVEPALAAGGDRCIADPQAIRGAGGEIRATWSGAGAWVGSPTVVRARR